jgi:hypothetical protein
MSPFLGRRLAHRHMSFSAAAPGAPPRKAGMINPSTNENASGDVREEFRRSCPDFARARPRVPSRGGAGRPGGADGTAAAGDGARRQPGAAVRGPQASRRARAAARRGASTRTAAGELPRATTGTRGPIAPPPVSLAPGSGRACPDGWWLLRRQSARRPEPHRERGTGALDGAERSGAAVDDRSGPGGRHQDAADVLGRRECEEPAARCGAPSGRKLEGSAGRQALPARPRPRRRRGPDDPHGRAAREDSAHVSERRPPQPPRAGHLPMEGERSDGPSLARALARRRQRPLAEPRVDVSPLAYKDRPVHLLRNNV